MISMVRLLVFQNKRAAHGEIQLWQKKGITSSMAIVFFFLIYFYYRFSHGYFNLFKDLRRSANPVPEPRL